GGELADRLDQGAEVAGLVVGRQRDEEAGARGGGGGGHGGGGPGGEAPWRAWRRGGEGVYLTGAARNAEARGGGDAEAPMGARGRYGRGQGRVTLGDAAAAVWAPISEKEGLGKHKNGTGRHLLFSERTAATPGSLRRRPRATTSTIRRADARPSSDSYP